MVFNTNRYARGTGRTAGISTDRKKGLLPGPLARIAGVVLGRATVRTETLPDPKAMTHGAKDED